MKRRPVWVLALVAVVTAAMMFAGFVPVPDLESTKGLTVDEIDYTYIPAPDFDNEEEFAYPVNITAIGEILEDGLTMTTIKIEYSDELAAGQLHPEKFVIPGRKIVKTYVNNSGERHEIAQQGKYGFLELLVNYTPDSNEFKEVTGNYTYAEGGGSSAIELPMYTAVKQFQTLFTVNGKKSGSLQPSQPGSVH